MSVTYCILEPWHTLDQVEDHDYHSHAKQSEVEERVRLGGISLLSKSWQDKNGRFVRYVKKGRLQITRAIRENQAAHDLRPNTLRAADALAAAMPNSPTVARRRVEQNGSETVTLQDITFDAIDVWFSSDRGKPVRVRLMPCVGPDKSAKDAAKRFLNEKWPGARTIKIWELGKHLKQRRQKLRIYREQLDSFWSEIVLEIQAGPDWSASLTQAKAHELPSVLLHRILCAYLEVPTLGPTEETLNAEHQGPIIQATTVEADLAAGKPCASPTDLEGLDILHRVLGR